MQFASSRKTTLGSVALAFLRVAVCLCLVTTTQPALGDIAIINGIEGLDEGQTLTGETLIRANILGQPDLVIYEIEGPVSFSVARQGNLSSLAVDEQTGEDIPWDTTLVPNGDYTLTVRAVVLQGNDRSQSIDFSVHNPLTEAEQNDSVIAVEDPASPDTDVDAEGGSATADPAPQVVVIGETPETSPGDGNGLDSVVEDLEAAQSLPDVVFGSTVQSYTRGSGVDLPVVISGAMPSDASVLAIAWSEDQTRMIDRFAHALDLDAPAVLAEQMDLLPTGKVQIQLLVRRSAQVHEIVRTSLEIVDPQAQSSGLPVVGLAGSPTSYLHGSGTDWQAEIDGLLPAGADVLVLAWSKQQQRMVDEFAFVLADDGLISSSRLDVLPEGHVIIQLLTRVEGQVVQRTSHAVEVSWPAPPEPPADAVPAPLPAVGFASAPAVYHLGSGLSLGLSSSGPLPADGDVVVIAWSNSEQRMIDPFAFTISADDDLVIPASRIQMLPLGETQLQLLVRRDDRIEALVSHSLVIEPAQPDEPDVVDTPAPSARPSVAFADTPLSYTLGSTTPIGLSSSGAFPEGSDLLVIAWSVSQNRLVDEFAFTQQQGPFEISADRMSMLPAGDVVLQLLPRELNTPYAQITHRVTMIDPNDDGGGTINPSPGDGGDGGDTTDPGDGSGDGSGNGDGEEPTPANYTIAFAPGASAVYERGSGQALDLSLSTALPAGSTVELRAWSYDAQAYVSGFSQTLAGSPWRIEPGRLDALADGEYRIDATLRVPELPALMASHALRITAAIEDAGDATPITPIDGFVAFTPSSDTRVIYVAHSGNDSSSGLNEQSPVRSLDKAYSLVRDGHPDWILLRRGDVFDLDPNDDGAFRWWRRSGRSANEPIVIGAYGDVSQPRPLIRSNGRGIIRSFRGDYVVFNDLHLNANIRDPFSPQYNASLDNEVGIWVNSGEGLFFQGCLIENFRTNLVMQDYPEPATPTLRDIRMHRCVIRDAYTHGDGDAHGMFINFASGFTVTETIFDHNGWHEDVPDSERKGRNHNAYFAHCDNVALVENVFARGSYEDLKFRNENGQDRCTNLLVKDNLFLACAYAIGFDSNNGDGQTSPIVYEDVRVTGNVFVRTLGWPIDSPGGPVMRIGWMDGGDFRDNLYCDPDPRNLRPQGIEIKMNTQMRDIAVVGNTADLGPLPAFYIFPSTANMAGLTLTDNPNNMPDSFYVDAGRTLEGYVGSATNAPSVEAFMDRMGDLRIGEWHSAYTASAVARYYKDGYERTLFD